LLAATGESQLVFSSSQEFLMDSRSPSSTPPLRVLFVCTGNSARSVMAEALLNHRGRGRFHAESAGSKPAARVNPHAVAALQRVGIARADAVPRGLDTVIAQEWDLVVTVCDRAKESCPLFPGAPVQAHWGMPDPTEVQGSEEDTRQAFDQALDLIRRRVDFLLTGEEQLDRRVLGQRARAIEAS
jgi:arsenate reductase